MKLVLACCLGLILCVCGCAATPHEEVTDGDNSASFISAAAELCNTELLQHVQDASVLESANSQQVADVIREKIPQHYTIIDTFVNGEFGSIDTPIDPRIWMQLRDNPAGSQFWMDLMFNCPRTPEEVNSLDALILQENLRQEFIRTCTPIRNSSNEIIGARGPETISRSDYFAIRCAEKHEPNDVSDVSWAPFQAQPIQINNGQPIADNIEDPQPVRVMTSFYDASDSDTFTVNIRDALPTLPMGNDDNPQVIIQVIAEDTVAGHIKANLDCGNSNPTMRCPDDTIGSMCQTESSSMELDIHCFVFQGDAQLNIEVMASPDISTCTEYTLLVKVL